MTRSDGGKREPRKLSRRRKVFFAVASVSVGLVISALLVEGAFRILEYRARPRQTGPGGKILSDERWGWKRSPGRYHVVTTEFESTHSINDLYMNGPPYDAALAEQSTRVMVLGDSHTFAVGVSVEDNWVQCLERLLNERHAPERFVTFNTAVFGYSLNQYLVRLIDQGPLLRPHYVIVGFSYATDLYDMLPTNFPERKGRLRLIHFDMDASGNLVERQYDSAGSVPSTSAQRQGLTADRVKRFLVHFAAFRYLRRSSLALFLGTHVKFGGQSLWPNMEIVLERDVSEVHRYNWRLAKAILLRIKQESEKLGAQLIVVGIPYLPQVYDDVWEATFGRNEQYSRTAAIERLTSWLVANGIEYVDTLKPLRTKSKETGRWLHHRRDAHPTAKGHQVIANAIVKANVVQPVDRLSVTSQR